MNNESKRQPRRGLNPWMALVTGKQLRDGDYIDPKTGLLTCGKCHTPKERWVRPEETALAGLERVPRNCSCRKAELARLDEADRQRAHVQTVDRLRRLAFEEFHGRDWRFDRAQQTSALVKLRRWAECWDELGARGAGLVLFGGVGTGKTFAAGCLANALVRREVKVRFVGVSQTVNRLQGLQAQERERYLRGLQRADLLILDDLGTERSTSYGREQVFELIDGRLRQGRSLVVTTNLSLRTLKEPEELAEQRIYDRVLGACTPLQFQGESFRSRCAADGLRRTAQALKGEEPR